MSDIDNKKNEIKGSKGRKEKHQKPAEASTPEEQRQILPQTGTPKTELPSSSIPMSHSRADTPPSRDYFSPMFSGTKIGANVVLKGFLDDESLHNLSQANRGARAVYHEAAEAAYVALIQQEIGPDPQRLIQVGEGARAAYFRHQNTIRGFFAVTTVQELAERMALYPDYYFNRIVTDEDFLRLFPTVEDLEEVASGALAIHTDRIVSGILGNDALFVPLLFVQGGRRAFQKMFPAYANQTMETLLADARYFVRLISSIDALDTFQQAFPTYANQVAETVLAEDQHFVRVISRSDDLETFQRLFPAYANQAAEKVFADDRHFVRLISSIDALETFQRTFPTYANQAAKKVLAEDQHFARVIRSSYSLETFRRIFPHYASQAVEKVLANDEYFAAVISADYALKMFRQVFPAYADQAVEKVLESDQHFSCVIAGGVTALKQFRDAFPLYLEQAVEKVLANDEYFAAVISGTAALLEFRLIFPAHHLKQVIEKLLTNDQHFSRIFARDGSLKIFKQIFPTYANRAEVLFKAKQQAGQGDAKGTGPSESGGDGQNVFSFGFGGASMFASGLSVTAGYPSQSSVEQAKEEAKEEVVGSNFSASTPAGDNGGVSTQESSGSSSEDLPNGDNDKNEGTGRNPPPSPRGG